MAPGFDSALERTDAPADLHILEQVIKELVFLETQSWMRRDELDSSETNQFSFMGILTRCGVFASCFFRSKEVCVHCLHTE